MSTVGNTIVTRSTGHLQLISVSSASPGNARVRRVMTQIKIPLPNAGGNARRQLGWLVEPSPVSQPLEL